MQIHTCIRKALAYHKEGRLLYTQARMQEKHSGGRKRCEAHARFAFAQYSRFIRMLHTQIL